MSAAKPVRRYPRKAEVARAVEAVIATGIPVGRVELRPDGTIALSTVRVSISQGDEDGSVFDEWERTGRL